MSSGNGNGGNGNGNGVAAAAQQVSPSIVVIIIVLTIIFFLSAFLHLLIRWLARNQRYARRRRTGSRGAAGHGGLGGGFAGADNRVVTLTALQGQLQQLFTLQDSGLERASIEELPVFAFKAIMAGLKEGADCAICLSEFQCDDELRLLPSCAHAFHTACIDTWLSSRSTCPLCRISLLPSPIPTDGCDPNLNPNLNPNPYLNANPNLNSSVAYPNYHPSVSPSPLPDLLLSELGFPFDSSSILSNHTNPIPAPLPPQPPLPSSSSSSSSVLPAIPKETTCSSISSHIPIPSILPSSSSSSCLPPISTTASTPTVLPSIPREPTCSSSHLTFLQPNPNPNPHNATSDSGRFSYTSLGNQSFAASEASSYGSGRRISVQLGKCRFNKQGTNNLPFFIKSKGKSKGALEYVFDNSSNVEVFVPDITATNPSVSAKQTRLNDLLNTSLRTNASIESVPSTYALGSQQVLQNGSMNPCWMSKDMEASRSSDRLAMIHHHHNMNSSEFGMCLYNNASSSSAIRAHLGSELRSNSRKVGNGFDQVEPSKRAVSFRLPENASSTNARLKASASRRSLSESEAFTFWEPNNDEKTAETIGGEIDNDEQRLVQVDDSIGQRSSSFAKRTMDWLIGWQKRMVHPDGSTANDSKV